ncbi:hypothetical protein BDV93DRAFT_607366 [Ceratobasidium sp. AG-I]|nr:hypothetical protein BDV93DRAFT_607366 [Ceratobasidium sp. AG-I]
MDVSYLTFTESPEGTADEHVKEAIKCIRQYNHVNVAKFVGVTEGYSGLDGIVVAMDGIELSDFLSRTHSGAVWAECIRGFEAFAGLEPKWMGAERITVAQNGRVVILPARSGGMDTEFGMYSNCAQMFDPGAKLLVEIYATNCDVLGPIRLHTFIDSLAKLGLGFTELDVMKLAADFRLFPLSKNERYYDRGPHLSGLQSYVGGFGRASYSDCKLFPWESSMGWESFGRSPYVQDKDLDPPHWHSGLEWCKSITPDGAEWSTYILPVPHPVVRSRNLPFIVWLCSKQVNQPFPFDWKDIFTAAQEISQRLEVDLSDISFLLSIECTVLLSRPQEANWDEIPVNLYYHCWNPRSDDPHKARGFYGADKTPDGGAWQERLQIRGWKFWFYMMDDDWGLQYERELKRIMATTPGSYPGAQVERSSSEPI